MIRASAHLGDPAARILFWHIAEQDGRVEYFKTSLASNGGLVPAHALTVYWSCIKTLVQTSEKSWNRQLKLVLAPNKKQPTLLVVDTDGQPQALLHGRLALPINPAVAADSAEAAALAQLAPSDITLLQQLCTSLAPALPDTMAVRDKWAADVTVLAEQLKSLPTFWRYDAVSLRNEQVNPD